MSRSSLKEDSQVESFIYLIPSINCAREVSERIEDKEFTWKEFGGVHPKWFGHKFYAADIQALWDEMWSLPENSTRQPHEIPAKALERKI